MAHRMLMFSRWYGDGGHRGDLHRLQMALTERHSASKDSVCRVDAPVQGERFHDTQDFWHCPKICAILKLLRLCKMGVRQESITVDLQIEGIW